MLARAITFAAALLISAVAQAQAPLKVGIIVTLSGPGAVLGQQARNGFMLALQQRGNKLGGRPTEVVVADDELKPDVAVTRVKKLLESDKVDFVVGPIFSNVLGAIFKPVTESGTILISPNAGASVFAGKACSPDFFVTSYENNQVHAVLGKVAQDEGYKRAFLMAPNYQAGKDAIVGFKSMFKGEIVEEDYVPLNQLDFQADLARIAAAKPDVIFAFMPGGLGVALVKQFRQSGLANKIPFLSAFTVDESTLPAEQDAALGLFGGMTWAPNMDNARTRRSSPPIWRHITRCPDPTPCRATTRPRRSTRRCAIPMARPPTRRSCARRCGWPTSPRPAASSASTPTAIRSRTSIW